MKNLRRLTTGRFLQALYFYSPFFTIFLQQKGLSLAQILILDSIMMATSLLMEIPTGILGDKFGRRWSILMGSLGSILAWVIWIQADSYWGFVVAYILWGLDTAFFSGAEQAFIYDELKGAGKEKEMSKRYGWYQGFRFAAIAISGLVGGWMAASHTMDAFYKVFYITLACNVVAFLVMLTTCEPAHSPQGGQKAHEKIKALKLLGESLTLFRKKPALRRLLWANLFTAPFNLALFYFMPIYFQKTGVPHVWFGMALFLSGWIAVGSNVFAHTLEKKLGVAFGARVVSLSPSLLWLFMALTFNPWLAILWATLNDGLAFLRDPLFTDYFNRHVESHNRATVLSVISLIESCYLLVMQPILGWIADIDLRLSFTVIAFIIAAGALLFPIREEHVKV